MIENAHVEEKAAAIEALGDIVENCMWVKLDDLLFWIILIYTRVAVWAHLKDIVELIETMLEFPNVQCSQNAVTAAGNLLVSIHKMTTQTQITHEQQLVQNGMNTKIIFSW